MHHLLYISEQHRREPILTVSPDLHSVVPEGEYKKMYYHRPEMVCFQVYKEQQAYLADTNYFVGVDWLVPGRADVYVEPKLNDTEQVNFLGMLLQSLEAPENLEHLEGLFHVDYDQPWISIPETKDFLSPILIVQFLKLVQRIVRKGLKKTYYRVTENLNSRVKGKILVSRQIKENLVKNRLTKTLCNYQEYGINSEENRFLKLVLEFVASYLTQQRHVFTPEQNLQLQHVLHYCRPAFEQVEEPQHEHRRHHAKKNVFYREYEEALKIGGYILKRYSFNINKTSESQTKTPPFWIDMSKLFELYVFQKLKQIFPEPNGVTYHDRYLGGKETDILLRADGYKCVIDCKYKPGYKDNTPSLEDKRQLAGYTRLKSVYDKLGVPYSEIVKGVLIYSHQSCKDMIDKKALFETEMREYVEFYKLGISLPTLSLPDATVLRSLRVK
ncbi:MAG: restriction endonuclease [Cytophagales bacterium]|nr:restriction endonuclease [Cytophagales bacterium]